MSQSKGFRKELVGSATSMLVLSVLKESPGHGYQIAQTVNERSDGLLKWREGAIYPMLHRLEKQGLIHGKWEVEESAKPRRVYRLTDSGVRALDEQRDEWASFSGVVNRLLEVRYA